MFVSVDCKTTGAFNKDRALEFVRRLESRPGHNSKTEEAGLSESYPADPTQNLVPETFPLWLRIGGLGAAGRAESKRPHGPWPWLVPLVCR